MRLYLDSNVIISLVNQEFGKGFEYMEQAVERFLAVCIEERHELVLSDLFFEEVKKVTKKSKQEVREILVDTGIVEVGYDDSIYANAIRLLQKRHMHYPDNKHAAIAIEHNCDYIVTWNLKDFDCISDLMHSVSPRDFS